MKQCLLWLLCDTYVFTLRYTAWLPEREKQMESDKARAIENAYRKIQNAYVRS